MLDEGVLPPGLTLVTAGASLLPSKLSVDRAGDAGTASGGSDLVGACCNRPVPSLSDRRPHPCPSLPARTRRTDMTTMAPARPLVTGGVDTHRDLHVVSSGRPGRRSPGHRESSRPPRPGTEHWPGGSLRSGRSIGSGSRGTGNGSTSTRSAVPVLCGQMRERGSNRTVTPAESAGVRASSTAHSPRPDDPSAHRRWSTQVQRPRSEIGGPRDLLVLIKSKGRSWMRQPLR